MKLITEKSGGLPLLPLVQQQQWSFNFSVKKSERRKNLQYPLIFNKFNGQNYQRARTAGFRKKIKRYGQLSLATESHNKKHLA